MPRTTVFLGVLASLLIVTCLVAVPVSAKHCAHHQFWSAFFNKCMNCTTCEPPDVAIKPCQGHLDTVCGPLSDLHIDWSFLKHAGHNKNRVDKEMTETFKENMKEIKLHEMHVREKVRILKALEAKRKTSSESQNKDFPAHEHPRIPLDHTLALAFEPGNALHFNSDEAKELFHREQKGDEGEGLKFDHEILLKNFGFEDEVETERPVQVSEKEMEFSTTEQVVLDYQTAVLFLAVASVVFFFVIALWYTLKHIRKWGRRNYAEELEELQFWLLNKKKDLQNPVPSTIYKTTTEVVSKGTKGNCKYLERLISKNAKKALNRVPGNAYHGAQSKMETKPLTREEPEVHKPTNV